jgi:DNA-binding NarL/FixJ family response regulator
VRRATYADTFAAADQVLRSAGAVLGLALPRPRFAEAAPREVAQALDDASQAVSTAAATQPDLTAAASLARAELAAARVDVLAWEAQRSRDAARRLTQVLRGCRSAASVDELAGLIPRQTAGLGYDRVLLSWVEHGRWVPCRACIQSDPDQATALVAAGQPPYRRVCDLLEGQVVRMRATILVRDALSNPRVHADLLAVTGSHSYVAAPLVAGEQVVGLIHADRNLETGTVDDYDQDLLALLAEGLGAALERLRARAEVAAIAGHAAAIQELAGRLGLPPMPPASAPPAPPDAWHEELTRREEQVLRLVAEGLSNAAIGERLFVAEGTVKTHVKSLMRKLGVATRAQAAAAYHRGG